MKKYKSSYSSRSSLAAIVLVLGLIALMGVETPVVLAAGITITNITPFAPVDSNNGCNATGVPRAIYVQTNVQNTTASPITGITVSFSWSTAGFSLQSGQASSQTITTLAAGATKALFWYVTYPCASPPQAGSFTVTATGTGGSGSLNGTLTTRSEISASAGGIVTSITAGPVPPGGGSYSFTVNYDFGNPAAGADLMIQPAANLDFNAGCFQLVGDIITASSGFTSGPLVGQNNKLYFTGVAGASQNSLTVEYDFIACPNTTTTADPFSDQTSGGSEKYLAAFGTTPVTTPLMSTQVSATSGPPGSVIHDTVTVSGGGSGAPAPTGQVGFYICGPQNPSLVGSGAPCGSTNSGVTSQVGVTKTLTTGTPNAFSSLATSDSKTLNVIGIFCWEVKYVSGDTNYTGATDTNTTNECTNISSPTAVTLSSFDAREAASGAPGHISVAWATGSEINTAGFNLYRSDSAQGPYVRINSELIPASNDALAGANYQYLDENTVAGHTYYYQLEDVELNGASVRHPAVEVTAAYSAASGGEPLVLIGLGIGFLALASSGAFILRRKVRKS